MGLVERRPCLSWTMWPRIVYSAEGQYFEAFSNVRPGQEVKLPALMALNQVYLTGKPATAWRYLTRAAMIGKS